MKNSRVGNILDLETGIICQQVNCQGVMGSGIAKSIREKYPQVWTDYSKYAGPPYTQKENGRHLLGEVCWVQIQTGLWIANIFGQQYAGREAKRYTSYDALDVGFAKVATMARSLNLPVHYPMIGCGLAHGNWTIVSAIIDANLGTINHTLWKLEENAA